MTCMITCQVLTIKGALLFYGSYPLAIWVMLPQQMEYRNSNDVFKHSLRDICPLHLGYKGDTQSIIGENMYSIIAGNT